MEAEHGSTGARGVAMSVLTKLGVAGPVPFVFNTPALANQT